MFVFFVCACVCVWWYDVYSSCFLIARIVSILCVLYCMMILCCFSEYALFLVSSRANNLLRSFVRSHKIQFVRDEVSLLFELPFLPVSSSIHITHLLAASSILYLHSCIQKHCKEVLMTWFISNNLLLFCFVCTLWLDICECKSAFSAFKITYTNTR